MTSCGGNVTTCGATPQPVAALPARAAKCILRGNRERTMEIPGSLFSLKSTIESVRGPAWRIENPDGERVPVLMRKTPSETLDLQIW
jgi:hypothetical protein